MMKRRTRKLVICCGSVIGILLLGILIAEGVNSLTKGKVDTSKGLKYIKQAEKADATKIEAKMQKLEDKDAADKKNAADAKAVTDQNTNRNYKAIFANSVIMGDSISEAFSQFDILNASSVVAKIGVELSELDEEVVKVKKLNPQIIFLAYGVNDIIATRDNTDEFAKEYGALLDKLHEKLPDTKIFVNSIFPVQQKAMDKEPPLKKIPDYNKALRALCDKKQIAFIDNTDLVSDKYYEQDGMHFKVDFYPYWLNRMAEVAAL